MHHVLTLIGTVAKSPLTEAVIDRARRAADTAPAELAKPDWLAVNEACDILFEGDKAAVQTSVSAEMSGHGVDVAVLPAAERRKKLLIADMDSTMIEQECIDELADETGHGEAVAEITGKAMRGEIEFDGALRDRVALLAGLPASIVDEILAARISLTPGGRTLVQTMRSGGAHTMLVSGGFTAFAGPIAARLGMDEFQANRLLVDRKANFTGKVAEPLLGPDAKRAALLERTGSLDVSVHDVIAIGDGANDLAMIALAGLGVAFRAKPALRAKADVAIDHGDLTAMLYLQGYRRDEFID